MGEGGYGFYFFFFSSRRRHTRCLIDWSSDVCSSDLGPLGPSTLSVTPICCPSFALGGSAVITDRTAPCQNAVALTSWLASPGAAVRRICHVPASAPVMLATCRTSTGESWPLIADESVHCVPSGR